MEKVSLLLIFSVVEEALVISIISSLFVYSLTGQGASLICFEP